MRYYNGENIIEVDESWDESPREAYREIILNGGYLPVIDSEEPVHTIFAWYRQTFTKSDDESKYIESWEERPVKIRIDINKLLSSPILGESLPNFIEIVKSDPQLSKWLIEECTYLRNSPMAEYACNALGMTAEQMENLVAACRK